MSKYPLLSSHPGQRARLQSAASVDGFRDAFPHVIAMLDDAVTLVAGLDEPVTAEFGEIALQEFDPPGFGAVNLD